MPAESNTFFAIFANSAKGLFDEPFFDGSLRLSSVDKATPFPALADSFFYHRALEKERQRRSGEEDEIAKPVKRKKSEVRKEGG